MIDIENSPPQVPDVVSYKILPVVNAQVKRSTQSPTERSLSF